MRKMAVKDKKSISMPRRMENVCFITKILDFFFFLISVKYCDTAKLT